VRICTDIDFGGDCKNIGLGRCEYRPNQQLLSLPFCRDALFRYPSMSSVGIPNDSLSSLKIPPGVVVVLYNDENFKGDNLELRGDSKDLRSLSWNDRASSMIVQTSDETKRQQEAQMFQSVVSRVVTAEQAAAAPKTCDTCCPAPPNPLKMPPASCSDVAVDLDSISNMLAALSSLLRRQHVSDLCKVSGSISDIVSAGTNSVIPNVDIAKNAEDLKNAVDSLLKQSKARVAFEISAQTAAAINAHLEAEKAKVDALKKKQDEDERKLRDDMAALSKAQEEQKVRDAQVAKDLAARAALLQKVCLVCCCEEPRSLYYRRKMTRLNSRPRSWLAKQRKPVCSKRLSLSRPKKSSSKLKRSRKRRHWQLRRPKMMRTSKPRKKLLLIKKLLKL
jgi:hypothetical protein